MSTSVCAAPGCRRTIPAAEGTPGRPAKFCSDDCRYRAKNRRRSSSGRRPKRAAWSTSGRRSAPAESPPATRRLDDRQGERDDELGADRDDEDQAPDDRGGEDGQEEPRATYADAALALAKLVFSPPPPRPPRAREIIVTPDQIRPSAGSQLARRAVPQLPAAREDAEAIVIYGVDLSAQAPPRGTSCQACHIRTGRTRCEPAVCRLIISNPQEFALPPMFDACRLCARELHEIGRIVEPPALLARHPA